MRRRFFIWLFSLDYRADGGKSLCGCVNGSCACRFQCGCLAVTFQEVVHSDLTGETGVTRLQIRRRVRMNIHKNARLTPLRREDLALAVIEGALSQAQAALKFAVTLKVVRRWVKRYETEGR